MLICGRCEAINENCRQTCKFCGVRLPVPIGEEAVVHPPIVERSHLSLTMGEEKIMQKWYKITIEEEQFENTLTRRSWEKGGPDKGEDGKGEYGYTPHIPQMKEVKRTIFTQDTEDLDLIAVIKAVNGIE